MTLQARVEAFAREKFGARAIVEKLPGDASDRSFFRVRGARLSSLILRLSQDEEGTEGEVLDLRAFASLTTRDSADHRPRLGSSHSRYVERG